jgi:hypothetical protein
MRTLAAAGGRIGASEALAARQAAAAEGSILRRAMKATGGNRALADRAIQQKASDIREEERAAKQQMQDEAREQTRQGRMLMQGAQRVSQYISANEPELLKDLKQNGLATTANVGADVIGGNFRGLAASALPTEMARTLKAFGRLADAIESRGREISGFSGGLTQKVVEADLRKMYQEMREAQVAGGAYGHAIEAQSKLQTGLDDSATGTKIFFADFAAQLMDFLNNNKEYIDAFFKNVEALLISQKVLLSEGFRAVIEVLTLQGKEAAIRLASLDKAIAKEVERQQNLRNREEENVWFDDFLLKQPPVMPVVPPGGGPIFDRGAFGFDDF